MNGHLHLQGNRAVERAETDRVEYCTMDGTVLETHPYPIWEDTGPSYCFDLVQYLLRSRYYRVGESLHPIETKTRPHPEMVRVVADDGKVIISHDAHLLEIMDERKRATARIMYAVGARDA